MNRPVMQTASRRLLLPAAVLMAASFCAFLFVVWQPRQAAMSAMALRQGELRRARLELEGFHRRHPDLPGFERALTVREERAERLFPEGSGSEEFLCQKLPELAESMGLLVEKIDAGDKMAEENGIETGKMLKPATCKLTLRGGYGALTDFLIRLEQGETFASVKSWQLKPSGGPAVKGELTLDMVVEIYERQ